MSSNLPNRDPSRSNAEQGLYRKFDVRRTDGSDAPGGKHYGCEYFVLDVTHDPLAAAALAAYAAAAEATHPQLAADMRDRYALAQARPDVVALNDDTIDILGRPNFACRDIAVLLRAGGADIRTRAENEQAATIAFLLNHYLADPTNWRDSVARDIQERLAALRPTEQVAP